MASELSKLIEDELDKVEGANRKDEQQKRLSSLRIKVSASRKSECLIALSVLYCCFCHVESPPCRRPRLDHAGCRRDCKAKLLV